MRPANLTSIFNSPRIAHIMLAAMIFFCGCSKPVPDKKSPSAAPSPAVSQPASNENVSASPGEADAVSTVVQILNKAQRPGAVILHEECSPSGIKDIYSLQLPLKLEPMDEALQVVSAKYQNLYWRESRESGVRIID